MLRIIAAVTAVIGLGMAAPAWAQANTPVLIAKNYFGRGEEEQPLSLQLARLDIEIEVIGASARTVVLAQFLNPTDQVLEADFTLDLPAGSVVTGYALDVSGAMIDGVLTGRRRATEAYEQRVRQGIDPGLAEVTRTNAFRTRVFPVLRGQGRTIRVEFVSPLAADGSYILPLAVAQPVGAVSVKVTTDVTSTIVTPKGLTLASRTADGRLEASAAAQKVSLSGTLEVRPDARPEPVVMTRHRSGDVLFEIDDVARGEAEPAEVRRVRVYWDRSVSRRDDNLAGEIELLRRYLTETAPQAIDLVEFADDAPTVRSFRSAEEVVQALKTVRYRGATSIDGLFSRSMPRAGACLFFSDGRVTIDSYRAERAGCPLFTVSSAADADRGFLQTLAGKSNGEHVDLAARTAEQALPILTRAAPRVVALTGMDGQEIDYRALPAAPGRFRIVGRAPLSAQVTVRLAGAWNGVRTYSLESSQPRRHDGAGALWAAGHVAELSATDQPDEDAVLQLARRYSVATPSAVFLVLEEVEDYAQAHIEPPLTLGREFLGRYKERVASLEAEEADRRAERLEVVLERWENQKEWWRTPFPTQARRPKGLPRDALARPVPPPPATPNVPVPADVGSAGAGVEALVVTASRREENIQDVPIAVSAFTAKTIRVEVAEWNPDRPYLKALAAADAASFWTVVEAQEREHGTIPAFYLDVGEFLFRAGRAGEARAVVTGALDLPTSNAGTLSIVAERLMRYGDHERAIWLYERVRFLEPDRPQPHRSLALALIERAEGRGAGFNAKRDYGRAMELLNHVIMTPWQDDFDGIELISLMEANRIIPRLQALGVKLALDPRLIALLPVDIRVVLEWNTDATDMDLWVREPSGEQAMYSRPLTSIGGRMSNDMTQGYGPEEYLLKRAPRGRYEVRVNVYNVDRLNPNGATRVKARIYRAFGRPEESSEVLELELKPDEARDALVGAITVGQSGK